LWLTPSAPEVVVRNSYHRAEPGYGLNLSMNANLCRIFKTQICVMARLSFQPSQPAQFPAGVFSSEDTLIPLWNASRPGSDLNSAAGLLKTEHTNSPQMWVQTEGVANSGHIRPISCFQPRQRAQSGPSLSRNLRRRAFRANRSKSVNQNVALSRLPIEPLTTTFVYLKRDAITISLNKHSTHPIIPFEILFRVRSDLSQSSRCYLKGRWIKPPLAKCNCVAPCTF